MPLEELMISAIDSRYSSPVSIQVPQQINELQDSAVGSSSANKNGRISTGIAESQDTYESSPKNKANELKEQKWIESRLEIYEKDKVYYFDRVVTEKQKAEQSKAFRPDQQGVQLHPSVTPVVNVSLAADLSANMLSMIRV
jgi:hypothetical protein